MMNELEKEIESLSNVSVTENGALGFATTNNKLVDLNFRVPSMREHGVSEKDIYNFADVLISDDMEYAVKWLFYVRDVREGLGEKKVFNKLFTIFYVQCTPYAIECIKLIAEYGRWKDLVDLCENPNLSLRDNCLNEIEKQLREDISNYQAGKSISLLAKWLPSINASNKARKFARVICKKLEIPFVEYRKMLSKLRAYLDVTEVKTSSNRWDEIDYNKVSSKANLKYANAFKKHDKERREKYLNDVMSGKSGVKMNASVLFPHEIWAKYRRCDFNNEYEAMWKNLKDMGDCGNTLCVVDGSGSMDWTPLAGTSTRALDVARAIGVYFAERCKGEFHNKVIEFSARPQFIDLDGFETLYAKIHQMEMYGECSNTNIEFTFDIILNAAVKNNIPQEEMPKNILVISDMEFDAASRGQGNMSKLFEIISDKYEAKGYKLPRLVFWNVNARTNTIPLTQNENGVVLVSGYSTNIVKTVMSGALDPWLALKSVLDSDRYAPISEAIKNTNPRI